jgi:hypothetical protein
LARTAPHIPDEWLSARESVVLEGAPGITYLEADTLILKLSRMLATSAESAAHEPEVQPPSQPRKPRQSASQEQPEDQPPPEDPSNPNSIAAWTAFWKVVKEHGYTPTQFCTAAGIADTPGTVADGYAHLERILN